MRKKKNKGEIGALYSTTDPLESDEKPQPVGGEHSRGTHQGKGVPRWKKKANERRKNFHLEKEKTKTISP